MIALALTFQPRSRPWETAGHQSSRHRDLLSSPGHLHPGQRFQGFHGCHGFLPRKKETWTETDALAESLWHCGQCLLAGSCRSYHFSCLEQCFVWRTRRKTCLRWEVCWRFMFFVASCRSIAVSVATWRPLRNSGVVPTAARPRPLHHHGHCRASRDSPWICAMVSQWSATVLVDSCSLRRWSMSFVCRFFSWRECLVSNMYFLTWSTTQVSCQHLLCRNV